MPAKDQFYSIANIVYNIIVRNETDISRERQRIATAATAVYVDKCMNNVSSVDAKHKVYDLALSRISPCHQNGLILEFGVFKGKSINYIAKKLPHKSIDGFDSFEGLPEFWRDGFGAGAFKLNNLPIVEPNVRLHKGWFDISVQKFLEGVDENICVDFLHVDCDLYSSTRTIFECLAKRIKPGTVIVFDEYFNYSGWEQGEFRAFQEFILCSNLSYDYITYNHLHEQVAVQIK